MKRLLMSLVFLIAPACAQAQSITQCVTATPTVDTAIYASGDLIGAKLTFSNALPDYTGAATLVSAEIVDKASQAVDMDLVLFVTNPSNTTFTDQATFDIADGDLGYVGTAINFGSSSRFAFNDNAVKYVGSVFYPLVGRTSSGALSTTLYGALISRGTPTFAASSDVTVKICLAWDSN